MKVIQWPKNPVQQDLYCECGENQMTCVATFEWKFGRWDVAWVDESVSCINCGEEISLVES